MPIVASESVINGFAVDKDGLVSFPQESISPNPVKENFGNFFMGCCETAYDFLSELDSVSKPKSYSIVKNGETIVPGVSNSKRVTYIVTFDTVAPQNTFRLISE